MAGCIILSIGAILQATAFGIPQMIVGRIVAGVGNGLNTSTIRMFLSTVYFSANECSCLALRTEQGLQPRKRS